jgi:hypothetical protein
VIEITGESIGELRNSFGGSGIVLTEFGGNKRESERSFGERDID